MIFCRRCSNSLIAKDDHYECPSGHIIFLNPATTVGVFFLNEAGEILLSIRGIEPNLGKLDCVGGFVDENETLEEALQREIQEETGLGPTKYTPPVYLTSAQSTYFFNGESRSILSCFFYATLVGDAMPVAGDDVAELVWISQDRASTDNIDVGEATEVQIGLAALLEVLA